MVHPVEHDWKFPEVHTVAGERHIDGLFLCVLTEVALKTPLEQVEYHVGSTQGVQRGPVELVLGCVVGAVIAAPARDALEVAALVEILFVELLAGEGLGLDELTLEKRPMGRRHGGRYGENRPDPVDGVHVLLLPLKSLPFPTAEKNQGSR